MAGGKLRKVLVLAAIGALVAAIVRKLRGEPAPQFANHPTVRGGPASGGDPAPPSFVRLPTDDAQIEAELEVEDELIEADLEELELAEELAEELVVEAVIEEIVETELVEQLAAEALVEEIVEEAIEAELAEERLADELVDEVLEAEAELATRDAEQAVEVPGDWVDPVDGECPDGYPIKAKLSSGIYHQPGGFSYDRTKPDRCYASAAAAEADGLRPAKR